MSRKPRIELCDVTPRDGDQSDGVSLLAPDKLWFARRDDEMGLDFVEAGFPRSNRVDRAVFSALMEQPLLQTKHIAFGMTRRKNMAPGRDKGLHTLMQSGAPAITLVGKSSRFHVATVLNVTPRQNLAMIRDSFEFLKEQTNAELLFDAEHYFDGFKEDPDYALRTLETARRAGATRLVLCDTNGGSVPEYVARAVRATRREFQDVILGIHPHNDRGLAVANMRAAVRAGVRHVQGTWNGIGERTGNLDLIEAIGNLKEEGYRTLTRERVSELTRMAEEAALHSRSPRNPSQPYTGRKAFAHKGGMHAAAVAKNPRTYEHMDPAIVGNERRILGSKQAGIANVRSLIAQSKLLSDDVKILALHDRSLLEKVRDAIDEAAEQGYSFDHADASLELLMLRVLKKGYRPILRIEEAEIHSKLTLKAADGKKHRPQPKTRAIVKARINGNQEIFLETAEDEGPIGALTTALLKAMAKKFKDLAPTLALVDYHVEKVPRSEEGEHSPVLVTVEFKDGEELFTTTGVSRNSIEAGWMCVVDAFEYKLERDRIRMAKESAA